MDWLVRNAMNIFVLCFFPLFFSEAERDACGGVAHVRPNKTYRAGDGFGVLVGRSKNGGFFGVGGRRREEDYL